MSDNAMRDKWQSWYQALKTVEPEAYFEAIRYAEGLSLTYSFPPKQAAEVERSHVMLACKLLGVMP